MIKLHRIRHITDQPDDYMIVLEEGDSPWPSLLLTEAEVYDLIAQLALELHFRLDW